MKAVCIRIGMFVALALLGACTGAPSVSPEARETAQVHVAQGKVLFEEKCRTVAGEKIYRKVENVEGIVLLKVRPERGDRELSDRMWPGAAFARESTADWYITSFLGYEHSSSQKGEPVTAQRRGYITSEFRPDNPSNLPGYRFVDVIDEKDGKRYRITGSNKIVGRKDIHAPNVKLELDRNPNYDLNVYRWTLDRVPAPNPSPRYGVTFEDHVLPEERMLGLASSTVKVLDLQTGEVLGELIRYVWSPGGPSRTNPVPWLTAYRCPDHAVGTGEATRKFVDQILIPAKE